MLCGLDRAKQNAQGKLSERSKRSINFYSFKEPERFLKTDPGKEFTSLDEIHCGN